MLPKGVSAIAMFRDEGSSSSDNDDERRGGDGGDIANEGV